VEDGIEKFNRLIDEDIPVQEKIEKMILLKAEGTDNISKEFMQDFYLGSEPELKVLWRKKQGRPGMVYSTRGRKRNVPASFAMT
jgi:hypothetical protein